jgi:hypothetical protein
MALCLDRAAQIKDRLRGHTGQPAALRVGPQVLQRLGAEQRAWGDQGFEEVLVEGKGRASLAESACLRCQPESKPVQQVTQGFRTRGLPQKTAGTGRARVVGGGEGDALVECTGEQRRLATARVANDALCAVASSCGQWCQDGVDQRAGSPRPRRRGRRRDSPARASQRVCCQPFSATSDRISVRLNWAKA